MPTVPVNKRKALVKVKMDTVQPPAKAMFRANQVVRRSPGNIQIRLKVLVRAVVAVESQRARVMVRRVTPRSAAHGSC